MFSGISSSGSPTTVLRYHELWTGCILNWERTGRVGCYRKRLDMNDSKRVRYSPDGVMSLSKSFETLSIAGIPNATVGVSQWGR